MIPQAERDVLRLAGEGLSTRWIAAFRGSSYHTVKTLLERTRHKLGARNTAHAIALAYREGLL